MQNLSELVRRLITGQVEFVLVGGFAALAHGSTLTTRDVDICCRFTETNLMQIQKSLAGLNPTPRSRPDLPLALTPEQCRILKNLYLKTDLGILDCLGEIRGIGDFEAVLKESVELDLPIGKCRILNIDALIRAKQAMDRPHDRIVVQQLQEIKKQPKLDL